MTQFPLEERLRVITDCRKSEQAGGFNRKQVNSIAEILGLVPANYKNKELLCQAIINYLLPTIPSESLNQASIAQRGELPTNAQIAAIMRDYTNRIIVYGGDKTKYLRIQQGLERANLTTADIKRAETFNRVAEVVEAYSEQIVNPELQLAPFVGIGKESLKRVRNILNEGKLPPYDNLPPVPEGYQIFISAPTGAAAAASVLTSTSLLTGSILAPPSGLISSVPTGRLSSTLAPSLSHSLLPAPSLSQSLLPAPSLSHSLLPAPSLSQSLLPAPSLSQSLLPAPSLSQSLLPVPSLSQSLLPAPSLSQSLLPAPSLSQSLLPAPSLSQSLLPAPSLSQSLLPAQSLLTPVPSLVSQASSLSTNQLNSRLGSLVNQIGTISVVTQKEAEMDEGIKDLMSLHGIGEVKAHEWRKQGIINIQDLIDKYNSDTLPFKLTDIQFLAIKYRKEIDKKIPREIVEKVGTILIDEIEKILPGTEGIIAGSYRRGNLESSDVDIVLTRADGQNPLKMGYVEYLLDSRSGPFLLGLLSRGDTKIQGIFKVYDGVAHKIDIKFAPPENLASEVLHATGNAFFNQFMSNLAEMKGYKLNKDGLFIRDKNAPNQLGAKIDIRTEDGFFAALGIEYIPPEKRNFSYDQRIPQVQLKKI